MAYDDYRPGGFNVVPPAIKTIVIINAAFFLIALVVPALGLLIRQYGALWTLDSGHFEIWQLVSYMFLHGGFFHILFNMFALWIFGAEIENYWGTQQFTIYYFTCGIGAGLLNILLTSGGYPTVGASGAVYGVLLAFGMMFPDRLIYIYFLIPIKAKYLVLLYAVIEFFSSFNENSGIAHFAHLGGMLVGFIYITVMRGDLPFQDWIQKSFEKKSKKPSYQEPPSSTQIKKLRAERVDAILDKISKSGYESLSGEEKQILLEASKEDK